MDTLSLILSPIVWVMDVILEGYFALTGSAGLSILMLSFTGAFLMMPVRKYALTLERRVGDRMRDVAAEVAVAKKTMRGEKLFLATEAIYKRHNYHPIQSVATGASFLVLLPILLSAIVLLASNELSDGKPFLLILDLGQPDGLFGPINLLPIVMSAITVVEAEVRFEGDQARKWKFYLIAALLFMLVHNLNSGLVLYWTGSNLFSLLATLLMEKYSRVSCNECSRSKDLTHTEGHSHRKL